jgi:hypothetical protein
MADYQEEVYIVERKEVSDDEGEDAEFELMVNEAANDEVLSEGGSSDEDLNDFNSLKNKTEKKKATKRAADLGHTTVTSGNQAFNQTGSRVPLPKTVEREVVIDDFIRNYLTTL